MSENRDTESDRVGQIAHIAADGRRHPLREHLLSTASLAASLASKFGCSEWGRLAGLWHDIGKYSEEFQEYLQAAHDLNGHVEERKGKIDHSTAGAQHAAKSLNHAGKVLAYVIAGHHSGLPDGISPDACLRKRLEKKVPAYNKCPVEILDPPSLRLPFQPSPTSAGIQFTLFIRMLYSCLVDADFLDTEDFMDHQRKELREGYRPLSELSEAFFRKLDVIRDDSPTSRVNQQREYVLSQCLRAGEREMGLFSLTVPTGGGKTLSSMSFALQHAGKHDLQRIIYVIPYTSIIEQNAAVFRSMFGKDSVLEHHSNFEPADEDYRSRLASENWDAPIVVTTNVQFFESLFANRSSRCRKLHNIANSVVVLDEVQTIPAPFLLPCLAVLRELVAMYRTSIVLCSATQPAVQKRTDFQGGLEGVSEIIDDPQGLAKSLQRTAVTLLPQIESAEIASRIKRHRQVLCIVNTRKQAKDLYMELSGDEATVHLSALMCPEHRSQTLEKIRERLKDGHECRVISTQLIEAGVDIDFPVVYRAVAGIDSIAQAAGRCNREGKLENGDVFVFTLGEGVPAGYLRQTAQAAESVIRRYSNDILSLAAIEDYFKLYYWTKGSALDEEDILASLQSGCQNGDFPFRTVSEHFRFIRDDMKPVVIPFNDDARRLIKVMDYLDYPTTLSRKLQRFTVSIYPNDWNQLLSSGSIEIRAGMFPVLVNEMLYKDDLGLCTGDVSSPDPESLVV